MATEIELSVSSVPGRKGKWLVTTEGSVFHALAKFRDEDAVTAFFRWVEANEGRTMKRGVDD